MLRKAPGLLLCLVFAAPAMADLKPDVVDCDAKRAARSAAREATVGVGGVCDPEKLADDTRDDARDRADDVRDEARDRADNARDRAGDRHDDRDHKERRER